MPPSVPGAAEKSSISNLGSVTRRWKNDGWAGPTHSAYIFITKMCVAWILPRSWRQATDRVKVWNHVWKYSPPLADWHLDMKTLCAINSSSCYVAMLSPSCLKLGRDCDAVRCTFHPFMNVNGQKSTSTASKVHHHPFHLPEVRATQFVRARVSLHQTCKQCNAILSLLCCVVISHF